MAKKILKIFAIVLAVSVVGVGILVGVMFLQGKFDEPYQEPTGLYFDIPDNVLNVTYDCTKNDLYDENGEPYNVYSFVLNARPANVTELNCMMTVVSGGQLIEFCGQDGKPLENEGVVSTIQIGKRIYFKIKNNFDNTSDKYNEAKGEVNLSFISENDLCNADLKIKIDRTVNQISLFDFNNTENNKHDKGVFNYENDQYVKVELTGKPESWAGYFIKDENGVYNEVDASAEYVDGQDYYRKDKTLTINTIANESYLLKPIFAPENSNEPFLDGNPKIVDIFVQNGYTYENIKDTEQEYIERGDNGYYFKGLQAGEYHLYLVSYPTYAIQEKFLAEFETNNNADYIFSNVYAITRHVVINVESSNVDDVYLNGGSLLNLNLNLFEQNGLVLKSTNEDSLYQALSSTPTDWSTKFNNYYRKVENSYVRVSGSSAPQFEAGRYYKKISSDLGVKMYANGKAVETRYNQIKFLNDSDFIEGNVVLVDTSNNLKIVINGATATLSGFNAEREKYNGTHACELLFDEVNKSLTISVKIPNQTIDGKDYYNISINSCFVGNILDGLTKLNFSDIAIVTESVTIDGETKGFSDSWMCKTGVVLVNTVTNQDSSKSCTLGTFNVGSYLIFSKNNENLNTKFEISSSGYGMDKTFQVRPLEYAEEVYLYLLVVNEDFSSFYTIEGAGVRIDEVLPQASIKDDSPKLNVSINATNGVSIKVDDLVGVEQGSYKIPLLFVEEATAKVHTIPQIRIKGENDSVYVLAGTLKTGNDGSINFVNEIIAKDNVIGEQELWVVFPKYEFTIENANDLVMSLLKGLELDDTTTDMSGTVIEGFNNYLYIGKTFKLSIEDAMQDKTIADISTSEGNILNVYLEGVTDPIQLDLTGKIKEISKNLANNPFEENSINLNIGYTDETGAGGEHNNSFNFTTSLKSGEVAVETAIIESTTDVKFSVNVDDNEKAQSIFDLIVDKNIDETDDIQNDTVLGLNKYFTIKINAYNKIDKLIYRTAFVRHNSDYTSLTLDNAELATYFNVSGLSYDSDKHELTLTFDIKSVSDDSFEKYEFDIVFEYNAKVVSSNRFTISSNAVTGYQLTYNSENYSFNDYYIVYLIDWAGASYKYNAYAIKKEDYNKPDFDINSYSDKIELFGAESLEDASLLSSNYIKALPEAHNADEYDFNVQGGGTVLYIDNEKKITINSLGETDLTITNKVKTNVVETISVKVVKSSNFEFVAKGNNITLSESSTVLTGNIFTFTASGEDILNTSGLVDFEIPSFDAGLIASNNAEGENKATEYYIKRIVDDITIVTLKYDNEQWKLERNKDYLLVGLSFKLKAKTLIGEVESTISYSTPIRISKNASNDMSGMEVVDYYKGTQLQLSCKETGNNTDKNTLFKLTNQTGNSDGAFKLEYQQESYIQLIEKTDWVFNSFYLYDAVKEEYNLVNEKPEGWGELTFNYTAYYTRWTELTSGDNLTLDLSTIDAGVYDMRIRYDYITYEFKVRIRENIIVNQINASDSTLNSESNPASLVWGNNDSSKIVLTESITAQKISNTDTLLTYTGASSEDIETSDLAYELIDDEQYNGIFKLNPDKEIYINWFETCKETIYPVTIKVSAESVETEVVYYIKVSTDYKILTSNDNDSLMPLSQLKISALTEQEINLYSEDADKKPIPSESYFVLSTGNTVLSDWSVFGIKFYNENGEELDYIKFVDADKYQVKIICETAINENLIAYMDVVYVLGFELVNDNSDWEDGLIYSHDGTKYNLVSEKPADWDDNYESYHYYKAKTLTSGERYPITVSPYKLSKKNIDILSGEEKSFADLFTLDWNIVHKLEVEVDSDDFNMINSNVLVEDNANLKLKAKAKGNDYSSTIIIRLYYYNYYLVNDKPENWGTVEFDYSNYFIKNASGGYDVTSSETNWETGIFLREEVIYEYSTNLDIRNANYAQVNYTFKDLNVDSLTFVDEELNEIKNLPNSYYYDIVLSNETINLDSKFNVYRTEDDSLTENKLHSITLVGVSNLQLNDNWKNKIEISETEITFGAFEYSGYALFKLTDSDGTWCYYLVRLTPSYVSNTEDYSLLTKNERKTVEKVITLSENITLSDLIKNEDTTNNDNYITSADISVNFNVPNQLILDYFDALKYYLIENDDSYLTGIAIGYPFENNREFSTVSMTKSFTIAVVIETQNGLVHLGNYKIYVMPSVSVVLQAGVEVVDSKNFVYSAEIDYIDYVYERAISIDEWATNTYYEKVDGNKYVLLTDETLFTSNPTNYYKKRESVTISMDKFITVDSDSIKEVTIENVNSIDYLTNCVEIDDNKLKLLKQVLALTEFDLKIKYTSGLVVTIKVKYLPFVNTNNVRDYSLGWNGSKFVTTLDLAQLVPNYTGSASIEHYGISDISNTSSATDLSSMSLNYLLTDNVQTGTLTITLDNVVDSPSYTFNITLGENINVDIAQGFDSLNPAKTILDGDSSLINLTINSNGVVVTGDEVIANINLVNSPSVTITFRDLNGNVGYLAEEYKNKTSGTTEIHFIPTASEVSGILTIEVNGHETEIYLNIVQSYQVQANYRITQYVRVESVSDWGTANIYAYEESTHTYILQYVKPADWNVNFANYYKNAVNYETVKVGDKLTLSEFNSALTTYDVGGGYEINANRFTSVQLSDFTNYDISGLFKESDTTKNKLKFQICYITTEGMVVDSTEAYAGINSGIITFNKEGTVYLRIYNDTGLDLYYKLEIQTDETYYNKINFNSENTSKGEVTVGSEKIQYYSTTITELTSNDGYKLARLKYNPTKDLYFNAYVYQASLDGSTVRLDGTNSLSNTDGYRGTYKVDDITLSWELTDYNIIYKISGNSNIEFAYFDIALITINGEVQKVRLYVTDTEIKFGATDEAGVVYSNKIYANSQDVSLWGLINYHEGFNGKQRVQILNNETQINMVGNSVYSVEYVKTFNDTLKVDDSSIVSERQVYSFDLKGVVDDTNLILYYDLIYNDIIIDRIEYRITVMNDINISINGFALSSGVYEGNIYLADYSYANKKILLTEEPSDFETNYANYYTWNGSGYDNLTEKKEFTTNAFYADAVNIDLVHKTETVGGQPYYRNAYIVYENRKTGNKIFNGENNNKTVSQYMKIELVDDLLQNFEKSDIQINDDGTIYLLKDTDGRFAIRISAQSSPNYSQIFVFNVVPSIVVSSTGYDDGNDGYPSNDYKNLLTTKLDVANTMFYVKNQKHDDKYVCVESKYSDDGIDFSYNYAIVKNLAEVSNISWSEISETSVADSEMTDGVYRINLPYVPVSTTDKYIVSYQVTITSRGTERTFVGSYLVKNNIDITLNNTDKKIESVSDSNCELTLADLVTVDADFINKTMVAFRNIVDDDESSENIDVYFDISSGKINLKSAKYLVDGSLQEYKGAIFNNNMTFDFVFVDKTNLTDLYTISGWTMTTVNSITPIHTPKALSDLFTETELGNNLYNKKFVAVLENSDMSATTDYTITLNPSDLSDTADIDLVADYYNDGANNFKYKLEKTIERTLNTYKIYSAKLTSGTSDTFYTNSVVYYFIVSNTSDFIELTDNYYIGQIIKLEQVNKKDADGNIIETQYYMLDGNGNRLTSDGNPSDLLINVSSYLRIWSGDSWGYSGTISSVTTTDENENVDIIDSYYIKITTAKLYELLNGENEANYSFGITVIYNSVQLDYQVSLNITLAKVTDETNVA